MNQIWYVLVDVFFGFILPIGIIVGIVLLVRHSKAAKIKREEEAETYIRDIREKMKNNEIYNTMIRYQESPLVHKEGDKLADAIVERIKTKNIAVYEKLLYIEFHLRGHKNECDRIGCSTNDGWTCYGWNLTLNNLLPLQGEIEICAMLRALMKLASEKIHRELEKSNYKDYTLEVEESDDRSYCHQITLAFSASNINYIAPKKN